MSEAMGSNRPGFPDDGSPLGQGSPGAYPPPGYPPPPGPGFPPPPGPGPWPPPAALSRSEERTWGLVAHLGALIVSLVTGLGVLVPLLVMLTKGTQSAFVRRHAVESLNFQITGLLVALVGGIVAVVGAVVTLGLGLIVILPLALAYLVFVLVVQIQASVRANDGQDYRYPLTLRLVS